MRLGFTGKRITIDITTEYVPPFYGRNLQKDASVSGMEMIGDNVTGITIHKWLYDNRSTLISKV